MFHIIDENGYTVGKFIPKNHASFDALVEIVPEGWEVSICAADALDRIVEWLRQYDGVRVEGTTRVIDVSEVFPYIREIRTTIHNN